VTFVVESLQQDPEQHVTGIGHLDVELRTSRLKFEDQRLKTGFLISGRSLHDHCVITGDHRNDYRTMTRLRFMT
jgi:hypothetical protein